MSQATQYAVQLVGPDELELNKAKAVPTAGPYDILLRIEAVGLCFSDLKLLKQFDAHARKSEIVSGLDPQVLSEIQSYVPGSQKTVPGHEAVAVIEAIGDRVQQHKVGERVLIQTDYRDLPTKGSNAAFGYNFEGALQKFVTVDERVVIDKKGQRFLIPVDASASASAVALVEPWACVEDSYVNTERQTVKAGGRLLLIAEGENLPAGMPESFSPDGPPAEITAICPGTGCSCSWAKGLNITKAESIDGLADESFDDIVYFGNSAATIEKLNDKLAPGGIMNLVLCGQPIGQPVTIGVGRVHYGLTRWIGTTGNDASESYKTIPAVDEIRENDKVLVIGAGGPMGQMHVIRNVCAGVKNVEVIATDFDDARLQSLEEKAGPMAQANGAKLRIVNPKTTPLGDEKFSYTALMAPVGALVAKAIEDSSEHAIINIFAGIPAPTKQAVNLDRYIEKRMFMFGTSGSVIRDMMIVLEKVQRGQLDTNCSVDAICGMAGAIEGIRAVENRLLAGKIIVYPALEDEGLIPLEQLSEKYPRVAEKLDRGNWTKEAEQVLLEQVGA